MAGWLYFMTNKRNGILYAGVTSTCCAAHISTAKDSSG